MKYWLFTLALLSQLASCKSAFAQKSITNQQLLWVDAKLVYNLAAKWSISSEFGERLYWFPNRHHQALTRHLLRYKAQPKHWFEFGGAYFSHAGPSTAFEPIDLFQNELRAQVGYINKIEVTPTFKIENRYWAEARFFGSTQEKMAFSNYRFRYKLQFNVQLMPKHNVFAYNEIHLNAGKNIVYNTFNQNRISAGYSFQLNSRLTISASYLYWFQQRSSGTEYHSRHITRLSALYKLNEKRSSDKSKKNRDQF